MNVLVAGGTGFLGRRVVHYLEQEGHNVVVHSRSSRTVPTRADVIVNCVGIIREWHTTFVETHVDMTAWLILLGKKLHVKQFVQVSALGVRSDGVSYQRTKRMAERLVAQSGLNYAIIRPSMLFGPGDESVSVFRSFSRTGFCPFFSYELVQPVHVDTVAQLVVAAVNRKIRDRIVEVGGPEVFTYEELLDRIHRGVHAVHVSKLFQKLLTSLSWLSPKIPTKDMLVMMTEDNVTSDTTVEKLRIKES